MSEENSSTETGSEGVGIDDDQLPEDLRPTDDNPLAQPLDEDEAKPAEELDMKGGKTPEQSDPGQSDSETGSTGEEGDSES